ncbi:MAG TPA: lysylphosphatidylglycerol synthase domain-containing protein [Gemmatimonadales bacterium]
MAERRWWWRAGQWILAIGVVTLATRYLAGQWTALQGQAIVWHVSVGWLLAGAAITWGGYAALIEAWRRVVVSQRQRLSFGDAARITQVSNLGKYIPGKVWAIAGAAYLAQGAGVAPAAAVASAVVLQALALASGVVLVALLAPGLRAALPAGFPVAAAALGAAALAGVAALTSRRMMSRLQRVLPASVPPLEPVRPGVMAVAFVVNVAAWGAYGAAFQCLARGLVPEASVGWALATSVFTASYLVGLVAAIAPGGVGVRESMFVVLLAGPLGVKLAGALALASRVMLTITELGAAVPFLIIGKKRGDHR